ncbi:MAG TPA: SRPBCC family protein [Gaiellaceae bacterium]|nr:SRPBCC family protein [Gaiellaceae bacterium]
MSDTAIEDVQETAEEATPGADGAGNGGLAKKLLIPAAAGVGTLAATVAARKAPGLFRERVMPRLEERGGEEAAKVGKHAARNLQDQGGPVGAVAGKVREKLGGAGGREKTRRLPIQRWTDIALPVAEVYERWTQFEEFPKFMHRVLSVEQKDDNVVAWEEKIWFSKRRWEGEITDRRKNDRIVWKTTQGTSHSGMVSFHKLDTNLTRVLVTIDFRPSGMIEKMASGLRFVKRATESDLARFKAYCEFGNAEGLEYEQPREKQAAEAQESDGNQSRSNGSNGSASTEEREQSRQDRAERREERRG